LIFKAFLFCSIDLDPAHRQTSKFMHPNTQPSESIEPSSAACPDREHNGPTDQSEGPGRHATPGCETEHYAGSCAGAMWTGTKDRQAAPTSTLAPQSSARSQKERDADVEVEWIPTGAPPWSPRAGAHYLTRGANGIWYARLAVPASLRALNPNLPREIRRSTRTAEKRLAATRARQMCLEFLIRSVNADAHSEI